MAIPKKDTLLVPFAKNFGAQLNQAGNPYGIAESLATAIGVAATEFEGAFNELMDARANNDGTKLLTATKDLAKSTLVDLLSQAYGQISASRTITDVQKMAVGVHVEKTRSTILPPSARPGVDLVSVDGFTLTLNVHDTTSSTKRGKPAACVAAWAYSFVGETYPSDPSLWNFCGAFTKPEAKIEFANSVPSGSTVWFCCAWVNAKGEAGPVSVPQSTILQGGVVNPAKMKLAA